MILIPEKRKVGGSTVPLTTSELRKPMGKDHHLTANAAAREADGRRSWRTVLCVYREA
jgi:hypothetical protein